MINKDESIFPPRLLLFFSFYIESTICFVFHISPDYTLIVKSVLLGGVGIESSGIMLYRMCIILFLFLFELHVNQCSNLSFMFSAGLC